MWNSLVLSMLAAVSPGQVARDEHGKLDWFDGSWEALLSEAETSRRLVLLDFWTEW